MKEKLMTLVTQGVLTEEQVQKILEVLKEPEEVRESIIDSLSECL